MFRLQMAGASQEEMHRGVQAAEALIRAYGLRAEFVQAAALACEDGRPHDEEAARIWYEAEKAAFRAAFGASRPVAVAPRSDLAQSS